MRKALLVVASLLSVYGPLAVAIALALVRSQRFAPWMAGLGAGMLAFVWIVFRGILPTGRWQGVLYAVYVLSIVLLFSGAVGMAVRAVRRGMRAAGRARAGGSANDGR